MHESESKYQSNKWFCVNANMPRKMSTMLRTGGFYSSQWGMSMVTEARAADILTLYFQVLDVGLPKSGEKLDF